MTRRIGFLGFDGMQTLDLVGPADAFVSDAFKSGVVSPLNGHHEEADAKQPYQVVVIGLTGMRFTTSSGLTTRADAPATQGLGLDTLIVPGGAGLRRPGFA